MDKTLVKKSDYLKLKYKFFINRVLIYFSFMLIPLWLQETLALNLVYQSIILILYMLFMGGQCYLMGKEIDHRLKIYYRANSSMERMVYRVVLGSIGMILLFNVFSLIPEVARSYVFWGFFTVMGLFYSWPTRGKIIEESMASQFGEIKFLDSFERTILILTAFTFLISLPEIQLFQNIEALKLYFDPGERVSNLIWNFLVFLYYPFRDFPKLYNLIWSYHFFFFGLGIFIFTQYCFYRYLFSRRLSLLGVYAVVSSWSFAKVMGQDFFTTMTTTVSMLWAWSIIWSSRSGTYRSGLLTGLVSAFVTMINPLNFILLPVGLFISYRYFLVDKTVWYKKQWLKYNLLGVIVTLAVVFSGIDFSQIEFNHLSVLSFNLSEFLYRKAFFIISPIGLILALFYLTKKSDLFFTHVTFDKDKFYESIICIFIIISFGAIVQPEFLRGFSGLWMYAFFALIPIEWIFQSISRLRSKRNLIYALYILICLLDSHLESRFRTIGKLFLDIESLKHIIQM